MIMIEGTKLIMLDSVCVEGLNMNIMLIPGYEFLTNM